MRPSFFSVLFLSLLTVQFSFGQANFESREKEVFAKNKVKRQIQWSYDYVNGKPGTKSYKSASNTYDANGNLTEEINYKSDGTITSVVTYTYDAKGNKTSFSRFKGNKEKLTYNQQITYDALGNKITESGFDGVSKFNNTFTYDSKNKLIEIKYTTDKVLSEKRSIQYEGNTTVMLINNAYNSTLSRELTTFDAKKNVIEEVKYIQDNVTQKANYTYDKDGNKVEETKQNYGNFAYRRKHSYDEKGNIVKITEEKPAGHIYIAYEYKYDSRGNVTEERWAKDNSGEYSVKAHVYDARNLLLESNCYFASYKFSVLYKYTYEFI